MTNKLIMLALLLGCLCGRVCLKTGMYASFAWTDADKSLNCNVRHNLGGLHNFAYFKNYLRQQCDLVWTLPILRLLKLCDMIWWILCCLWWNITIINIESISNLPAFKWSQKVSSFLVQHRKQNDKSPLGPNARQLRKHGCERCQGNYYWHYRCNISRQHVQGGIFFSFLS